MLKSGTVKNFDEHATQIFVPYNVVLVQKTSCVDLVWDKYIENTLKSTAITKRGKEIVWIQEPTS